MYPEFIVIYVMLIIVIAMLGVLLFIVLKHIKGSSADKGMYTNVQQNNASFYGQPYQQSYEEQCGSQQAGGIVFCNHCATQFNASQGYCPNCGARR